jgi:calcineurin-like phosphoesterase
MPTKFPIARGIVHVCGALIQIDPETGKAAAIERFQRLIDHR